MNKVDKNRPVSSINNSKFHYENRPKGSKVFRPGDMTSQGGASIPQPFVLNGVTYNVPRDRHWTANYPIGMERLKKLNR